VSSFALARSYVDCDGQIPVVIEVLWSLMVVVLTNSRVSGIEVLISSKASALVGSSG
jgi:hypothetical protein